MAEPKELSRLSPAEVDRRKKKAAELIAQDRQGLLMKMPFIGGVLMRLDIVPVYDERLETAATDGDRIYFDVEFYSRLGKDERLFVLAHEAWHCVLLHFARRQDRDPELFNVAADLEIHFILTDEKLKAPFVLPHDPYWRGLSAEEIYERYPRFAKGQPDAWANSQTSGARESAHIHRGEGGSFDSHLEKNGGDASDALPGREGIGRDPEYDPQVKPGTEERCRERLTAVVQQYERTRGTLPGHLAGLVGQILKPEIDWRELLSQFVTSCYGGSRRWLPPARRHVWQGLYLQSQRTECLRAVVAVDTSGSVVGDLPRFFSELNGLLGSFGAYELTVIQCDAKIGKVEKFDDCHPFDPAGEREVTGGGGTDFRPVFEYVDEHPEIDPSLLIYLTDGDGTYPEYAPSYPVMWVLTSDGNCAVDWGTRVSLK